MYLNFAQVKAVSLGTQLSLYFKKLVTNTVYTLRATLRRAVTKFYSGNVVEVLAKHLSRQDFFLESLTTGVTFAISFRSVEEYSVHIAHKGTNVTLVSCGYVFNSGPWIDDLEKTIKEYLLVLFRNRAIEHLNDLDLNFTEAEINSDILRLYEGKTITSTTTFVNDTITL